MAGGGGSKNRSLGQTQKVICIIHQIKVFFIETSRTYYNYNYTVKQLT